MLFLREYIILNHALMNVVLSAKLWLFSTKEIIRDSNKVEIDLKKSSRIRRIEKLV